MEKQWFVVHTLTGQESKVRDGILKRVPLMRWASILVSDNPHREGFGGEAWCSDNDDAQVLSGYVLVI
jgi:transcription antitermination factor NusG